MKFDAQVIVEEQQKEFNDLVTYAKELAVNLDKSIIKIPEDTSLDVLIRNECLLENIADKLRFEWQKKAFYKSAPLYKSPPEGTIIKTNSSKVVEYGYERNITMRSFEKDIHIEHNGFNSFTLLYSSAMSGLLSIIHAVEKLLKKKDRLKGGFIGGYFESLFLSQEISNSWIEFKCYANEKNDDIIKDYKTFNFIVIEPVKYNFNLEVTDIDFIMEQLAYKENEKILFLIVDSTLLGNSFPLKKLLASVNQLPNVILINLRSGLKMDQQGLEFSNVGIASFYFPKNMEHLVENIHDYLEGNRGILGTGLSFYECCLIDFPSFGKECVYSDKILENNLDFSRQIIKGKNNIIKEVLHPGLLGDTNAYHRAPFIFLKLNTESSLDYELVVKVIQTQCMKMGLVVPVRNSYGFRNICIQYIKTVERKPKLVLKIAVGKIKGIKFFAVLDIINKISEYNSFCDLRKLLLYD